MSRTILAASVFSLLVVLSYSSSVARAQEKGVAPPAPLPSQIFTAKKVFVSNGGLDGVAFQAFHRLGGVNQPYNAFYAAMKEWGKYALVFSPAEADLVFEIRFNGPFMPQLNLTIYDEKTHFVLWTILSPVQGAFRRDTFVRNMNQGIATLMADLRSLQSQSANSASSSAP